MKYLTNKIEIRFNQVSGLAACHSRYYSYNGYINEWQHEKSLNFINP